uniref:Putative secreted protein n=1 Tax=Anopheles triannulatus TaxID=58253 RepID=A0A2M4B4A5_9DIPT
MVVSALSLFLPFSVVLLAKLLTYQIVQVQVEPMKVHRKAFSHANTNGSRPLRRHRIVPGISCIAWPVAVG